MTIPTSVLEGSRRRMRRSHNRLFDLLNLELPVIAAVNGHAAGAGFSVTGGATE